ncbi:ANTAR domain-containing protein [Saccharothrix sp. Mg75]|uniref:ANTAR domain-containing protein n=1 Tax=Saccharothrix sp. Mg75 TaxID=3445357 RepID=UPI003EEB0495
MDGQWDEAGGHVASGLARRLDEVTGALAELSAVLDQEERLSTVLDQVCRQVARAVPGTDVVSVTLLGRDGPTTAAATGRRALDVDSAQYRTGEGPCLEAGRAGRVVQATVSATSHRWPVFSEVAARSGVACYLSAPLRVDEEWTGSLNLYGGRERGFEELDAAVLELYTTAAEAALRNARRYQGARRQAAELGQALVSRAVIDQAKGIVMAVHRISADEAFAMPADRSQRENVKLRDLAQRFVDDIIGSGGRVAPDR